MADSGKGSRFRTSPVVWGLIYGFNLSLITLIIYIADLDLPDNILFLFLTILRYSSIFVCVFSIYLIITNIVRLIRRPNAASALKIALFLLSLAYGAGIIVFNAFIVAIAGGN